jgi:hypothetical protein
LARLAVDSHAVLRFVERWRPGASTRAARAELEQLAAGASPTKGQAPRRDARIYTVTTPAGEVLHMLVRRGETVVTVLAPGAHGVRPFDQRLPEDIEMPPDPPPSSAGPTEDELVAWADEARESERLAAVARQRWQTAEETLALWKRGADLRRDLVERACEVLGIEVPERSAAGVLTIAGGRWDGVAITLREEESLNTIVSRLLAALRSR